MLGKVFVIALACFVGSSSAKLLDVSKLDLTNINCNSSANILDECSLQQSYSFRHREVPYPASPSVLMASCKRSADSLKCLRAYSKCLLPFTRQVMNALTQSRKAHNKKVCTDIQSEGATKFMQLNQCCMNNKICLEKGSQAEFHAIVLSDAIAAAKMSVDDRLKYACCSTATIRREFIEATLPHCKQYTQAMTDLVDSYVSETVSLICPDFNNPKPRFDCSKLTPLNLPKVPSSLFFVRPTVNVVQHLNPA